MSGIPKNDSCYLICARHGWDKGTAFDLYKILDWMMRLPDEMEEALWEDIQNFEESEQMRYVSSFERILTDRGFKKGLMQGEVRLIARQLKQRFGDLPAWVEQRLQMATESDLARWADAVLSAESLESILGPSPH